jgi:hypothetical protein
MGMGHVDDKFVIILNAVKILTTDELSLVETTEEAEGAAVAGSAAEKQA